MTTAPGAVAARLKARPRKTYPIDLAAVLGLPDPAPALVRIARSGEDDDAITQGFAYVEKATAGLGPEAGAAARADGDLLGDAKSKAALALAFRDAGDPSQPLFPNADFLRDNLSTDEVAALTNIVAEFRRVDAHAPLPDDTGIEVVLGLICSLADQGHEAPGVVLSKYPREVVTYILVEVAVKLRAAREALAEKEAIRGCGARGGRRGAARGGGRGRGDRPGRGRRGLKDEGPAPHEASPKQVRRSGLSPDDPGVSSPGGDSRRLTDPAVSGVPTRPGALTD